MTLVLSVRVRGQLGKASSLLLPRRSRDSNSGHWAWRQVLLLAEQSTSPATSQFFNQNNGPRSSKSSAYSVHTVSFYGDNLHRPVQSIQHSLQGFLKQSVSNKAKSDGVQPISDCFLHQMTPLLSRWQQR